MLSIRSYVQIAAPVRRFSLLRNRTTLVLQAGRPGASPVGLWLMPSRSIERALLIHFFAPRAGGFGRWQVRSPPAYGYCVRVLAVGL